MLLFLNGFCFTFMNAQVAVEMQERKQVATQQAPIADAATALARMERHNQQIISQVVSQISEAISAGLAGSGAGEGSYRELSVVGTRGNK